MKGNVKENIMRAVFFLTACISIVAVAMICVFLFANGIPAMKKIGLWEFLSGMVWKPSAGTFGIYPMIIASIYVTALALIIGVPVGVLTAIFLARFCPRRVYTFFKQGVELLSGIPSVVYGFFGLMVIVPWIRNNFGGSGTSLLAAALVLAIMILPTIIAVSEASLRAVNNQYYEGSLALGATHERSVMKVVVPAASSGIFSAAILGVGRAIGETMAVIMVAGNQAMMPQSLIRGIRTMTANIVIEMGYATDLHREALIATAVVLFVFVLVINLSFSFFKRRNV